MKRGGKINYLFDLQRTWPNSLVFYLVTNHPLNRACGCGRADLILEDIQASVILVLRSLPNPTFWKVEC